MTLEVRDVRYLVSCDGEDHVAERVNVLVEDGVIRAIGKKRHETDAWIDASRMVMYPGLVNTHHHLYQTFSRNLPEVQNLELFPWLKYLYEIWKNLNADVVYYSSLIGMGELLKSGCTTCFDHHYVFPKGCGMGLMDAQFAAADALGMRFHASRGSMDLSVKDGGLPPDSVVQTLDEIMKDSEEAVRKYHENRPYSMHRVALAPCSPFSVSRELLVESAKLARKLQVRLHTHLCETRDEENYMQERFGLRPLAYMEEVGWLGEDVWFAHGIHLNDEEIALLALAGTGIAHCPISNMKLSSGICNVSKMRAEGVPVGLAVDGSASNDGSSLLEEMRVAYLLHRLRDSHKAPSGYDFLKMATVGGARLLGREDLGYLKEGMAADFFLIDLDKIALVGAQFDPKSLLATVGYRGSVDFTVVNGKVVVREGRLVGIDEEELVEQANRCVTRYLKR